MDRLVDRVVFDHPTKLVSKHRQITIYLFVENAYLAVVLFYMAISKMKVKHILQTYLGTFFEVLRLLVTLILHKKICTLFWLKIYFIFIISLNYIIWHFYKYPFKIVLCFYWYLISSHFFLIIKLLIKIIHI